MITKNEPCMNNIYDLCESELNMKDVRHDVRIDRAHRLGAPKQGKVGPILA